MDFHYSRIWSEWGSVRRWCKENQANEKKFYYWQHKYADRFTRHKVRNGKCQEMLQATTS